MFQFVRGIALVAAMLLSCGASFAEIDRLDTANFMMARCRSFIAGTQGSQHRTGDEAFYSGVCVGTVDTLVFAGNGVCRPAGATVGQAVRIVVKYIDDRPAMHNETSFKLVARHALRAAWPCKN